MQYRAASPLYFLLIFLGHLQPAFQEALAFDLICSSDLSLGFCRQQKNWEPQVSRFFRNGSCGPLLTSSNHLAVGGVRFRNAEKTFGFNFAPGEQALQFASAQQS